MEGGRLIEVGLYVQNALKKRYNVFQPVGNAFQRAVIIFECTGNVRQRVQNLAGQRTGFPS